MLLIFDEHAIPGQGFDLLDNGLIGHGERKKLCLLPWHVDHRELALVGLADPTLLGQLLNETDTLTRGINVVQCRVRVEKCADNEDDAPPNRDPNRPLLGRRTQLLEAHALQASGEVSAGQGGFSRIPKSGLSPRREDRLNIHRVDLVRVDPKGLAGFKLHGEVELTFAA